MPRRKRGAQPDNKNAQTHGFYADPQTGELSIDAIITDLARKQANLSEYIDDNIGKIATDQLASLLTLFGQNASRLGRLLRDRRAISGEAADGIAGAIAQALDELGTELGVEL